MEIDIVKNRSLLKFGAKLIFGISLLITISGELMANSLPKYYTKTLENGLEIVAIPMRNNSNVV